MAGQDCGILSDGSWIGVAVEVMSVSMRKQVKHTRKREGATAVNHRCIVGSVGAILNPDDHTDIVNQEILIQDGAGSDDSTI